MGAFVMRLTLPQVLVLRHGEEVAAAAGASATRLTLPRGRASRHPGRPLPLHAPPQQVQSRPRTL